MGLPEERGMQVRRFERVIYHRVRNSCRWLQASEMAKSAGAAHCGTASRRFRSQSHVHSSPAVMRHLVWRSYSLLSSLLLAASATGACPQPQPVLLCLRSRKWLFESQALNGMGDASYGVNLFSAAGMKLGCKWMKREQMRRAPVERCTDPRLQQSRCPRRLFLFLDTAMLAAITCVVHFL
jgi:hypothetical protein